jgi:hypothetical protein
MKFPIGFTFVCGFFTYEVVGYDEKAGRPYKIKFGYSSDDEDSDFIDMTEHELQISSDRGV